MSFTQGYYGLPPVWYSGTNYRHLFSEPGFVSIADGSTVVYAEDSSCVITPLDQSTVVFAEDYSCSITPIDFQTPTKISDF